MAVTSRSFGYSLPCSMMVPFADNMNHTNIQSDIGLYEIGMDDHDTSIPVRMPKGDLPTDCKVWLAGYQTATEEDDTENEASDPEEEDEEEEENWTWYNDADPKNVYFKLTTVTGI